MAKKKKLRQKRQQSPGDSSDDNDDTKQSGKYCAHATRAVNLTSIKKILKNVKLDECQQCIKEKKTVINESVGQEDKAVKTLSMCLQCGNVGCNEEESGFHSKQHYLTPRSDCHALIVNTTTWIVWCNLCNDEIKVENYKLVADAVNFIKKTEAFRVNFTPVKQAAGSPPHLEMTKTKQNGADQIDDKDSKVNVKNSVDAKKKDTVEKKKIVDKVKGLSNLGNTCFFNAVLQNLIQTPWLYEWLEHHCKNGYIWNISAPLMQKIDDNEKLDIVLPESGELTQAFLSFLQKINNGNNGVVINPSHLFGQMCKKAPQFKGYQQQDSHELLCHLFDAMKNEEIKRQRNGILRLFFKTSGKLNMKTISEETKAKIKALSPVSSHTFVDVIFGGQLLSTVTCEECGMLSQRFESFLNLSLPVAEEKPLRPGVQKKNAMDKVANEDVALQTHSKQEIKLNKQQEARMKRLAKRRAKEQAKAAKKVAVTLDQSTKNDLLITEEQNELDDEKSDQTEADVEDNIEIEPNEISNRNDKKCKIEQNDQSTNALTNTLEKSCSDSDSKDQDDIMISMEYFASLTLEDCDQVEDCEPNCTIEPCNSENLCNEQISESKDSLFDADQDQNRSPEETSSISSVPDRDEIRFGSPDSGISNSESERASNHEQSNINTISSKTLCPRYHPTSNECSVLSCLYQFTAPELLMGNNKFGCENCTQIKYRNKISNVKVETVYSNASKQLLILSPPAILILHLKRFQQVGMNLRKVNRHVEFPLKLDLAPFCSSDSQILPQLSKNQKEIPYSLYGVVEHSGRLTGGHYTAYVKTRHTTTAKFASFLRHEPLSQSDINTLLKNFSATPSEDDEISYSAEDSDGKWYYVSDGHVKPSSESQVLKSQGYLLFYERIV